MKIKAWNVIRLLFYQWKEWLMKGIKAAPFFVLLGVLLISLWFLGTKSKVIKPVVLICNEDDSFIGKMFLNGVLDQKLEEVISFREAEFEQGKKQVNTGFAECMLHIKKDTISTLYKGETASLDFFVRDRENDFSKFLIAYVKGFVEIINTSQNAGLYYMDVLYEKGMTEEKREKVFQDLQFSYVTKALARKDIFERIGEERRKIDIQVLFFASFVLLVILSILLFKKSLLWKKEKKDRLLLSGYHINELVFATVLFVGMMDGIVMFTGICLIKWLGIG